jgi:hypothetical protein
MVAMPKMVPYAAGLAAVLALGACSGGDPATAQTVSAPSVTSTSPGPSPTSSAPSASTTTEAEDPVLAKIPKEARAKTQKGAEAFVAFFMNSLNTAATRADPDVLQGLYDEACKTCASMQATIVDLHEKGERYEGASLTVREAEVLVFGEAEKVIRVAFDEKRVKVVNRVGTEVGRTKPASTVFAATVAFTDSHWVIQNLQRFKS